MRPEDRVRVAHMVDAADALASFIRGRARVDLETDRQLLFAVVRAIEVIGEAGSKMSPEGRQAAPDIPWAAITGMRNRLIHGYFDVDTDIVWNTASSEIPALVPALTALADS